MFRFLLLPLLLAFNLVTINVAEKFDFSTQTQVEHKLLSSQQEQQYQHNQQHDPFSLIREKMRSNDEGQQRSVGQRPDDTGQFKDNIQIKDYSHTSRRPLYQSEDQVPLQRMKTVQTYDKKDHDLNLFSSLAPEIQRESSQQQQQHQQQQLPQRIKEDNVQQHDQHYKRLRQEHREREYQQQHDLNERFDLSKNPQVQTNRSRERIIPIDISDYQNYHRRDRTRAPLLEPLDDQRRQVQRSNVQTSTSTSRERLTSATDDYQRDDYQQTLPRGRLHQRVTEWPRYENSKQVDDQSVSRLEKMSTRETYENGRRRKRRDTGEESRVLTNTPRSGGESTIDSTIVESSTKSPIEIMETTSENTSATATIETNSTTTTTTPSAVVETDTATESDLSHREETTMTLRTGEDDGVSSATIESIHVMIDDPDDGKNNESDSNREKNDAPIGIEAKSIDSSAPAQELPMIDDSNEETTTHRPIKKPPPPINMTEVDRIFKSFKSDSEVVEIWQQLNQKMKDGMKSLIGALVPSALKLIHEARISSNCSGAMLKWVLGMNQLKSWSIRMLDAIGKPDAGLLEGSMTLFGNYRQCLRVRAPDDDEIDDAGDGKFRELFRGKYCVIQMKPWLPQKKHFYNFNTKIESLAQESSDTNDQPWQKTAFDELTDLAINFNFVSIRLDLCLPSMCQADDLQRILNYVAGKVQMRSRILRCEVEGGDSNERFQEYPPNLHRHMQSANGTASENQDTTFVNRLLRSLISLIGASHDNDPTDWIMTAWAAGPIILISITLSATVTIILSRLIGTSPSTGTWSTSNGIKTKPHRCTWVRSMSIVSSWHHHVNADHEQIADSKPLALYGLRFVIIMWFILVESAIDLKFEYLRELLMLKDLIGWWPLQIIINSSLQFDTIILLSAFTCAYYSIDANMKTLIKYTCDKYFRLAPSIIVVAAMAVGLPHIYKGPVWTDYVAAQAQTCKNNGWINLLFIQNLLPYEKVCLPHSWLLCVELQLFVVMIPILHELNRNYEKNAAQFRWRTRPVILLVLAIFIGWAFAFYNVQNNQLPPAWLYTMPDPESRAIYFSEHMFKTITHLSTFAIGILAGHMCRINARTMIHLSSDHRTLNFCRKLLNMFTATVASATMITIIFSTHEWSNGQLPSPFVAGMFDSTARIAWAISFTWILHHVSVPNEKGQYSLVSRALSHPVLVGAGRLSFLAYLVHPLVHTSFLAIQEQPAFSSWLMLFHVLSGNVILTMSISFIISVLVELPVRNFFKRWFSHGSVGTHLNHHATLDTKPDLIKHHLSSPFFTTTIAHPRPTIRENNNINAK